MVFRKGYGYQNIEESIPVDPEKTLFRIGSTTKLFTWLSVMQLVEEGRLDLREDISQYLDFEIPGNMENHEFDLLLRKKKMKKGHR